MDDGRGTVAPEPNDFGPESQGSLSGEGRLRSGPGKLEPTTVVDEDLGTESKGEGLLKVNRSVRAPGLISPNTSCWGWGCCLC